MTLCAVDQGGGQDGFVVDDGRGAVAIGIEAKVVVHQGLAAAGETVGGVAEGSGFIEPVDADLTEIVKGIKGDATL